MTDSKTAELPSGYRVLNDGPGREVLIRGMRTRCPVFSSGDAAAEWAWTQT